MEKGIVRGAHGFAVHVTMLKVPLGMQVATPVPDLEYPWSHVIVIARAVVPEIDSGREKSEFATDVFVHWFGVHVSDEKSPLVPQRTGPVPLCPASQVTTTASPVTPTMELLTDLSEFVTDAGVQGSAAHVTRLKVPIVEQVAVPPGPYPSWHVTCTAWLVEPVSELATEKLAEKATCVGVQAFGLQSTVVKVESVWQTTLPPPE